MYPHGKAGKEITTKQFKLLGHSSWSGPNSGLGIISQVFALFVVDDGDGDDGSKLGVCKRRTLYVCPTWWECGQIFDLFCWGGRGGAGGLTKRNNAMYYL